MEASPTEPRSANVTWLRTSWTSWTRFDESTSRGSSPRVIGVVVLFDNPDEHNPDEHNDGGS